MARGKANQDAVQDMEYRTTLKHAHGKLIPPKVLVARRDSTVAEDDTLMLLRIGSDREICFRQRRGQSEHIFQCKE